MPNSSYVTEDRVTIMITEQIGDYHKENVGRFTGLDNKLETLMDLVNKLKGGALTLVVIGGLPGFLYYCIKIVKELK